LDFYLWGHLKKTPVYSAAIENKQMINPFPSTSPHPGIFKRVLQFMLQHVLAHTDSGGGKFERLL